ncbi:NUDIX domain-containing protein [Streptomyces sp. TLI_146]|uniref:NUDIX domain-containing protein n=1 Tax=Streptomyces sp. TLI_146 TaxID=1938858 RepID=UPI000C70ABBD|nr:NUDIX hydrolase [Streptomyces sp. TLI_146]PKV82966.1 8-oxo-dGTP pyrophosphatase MutT (NUDIX family) [Streptomyces sp. TLI_146]
MNTVKPQRAMATSAAAAFIQRADGRVLLVHHAGTRRWVMPGGKADDGPHGGETPLQCCEREGREETGVAVTAGRLLVVQWLPAGRIGAYGHQPFACHLFVFAATIHPDARIRVPARELLGWDWWDPAEASGAMCATNARLLAAAVRAAAHTGAAPVYLEGLAPSAPAGGDRP